MGRQELISELENTSCMLLVGHPGIGKSWIGEQLAKRSDPHKAYFPYRFRENYEEGAPFIWKLAEFFSHHKQQKLKRYLNRQLKAQAPLEWNPELETNLKEDLERLSFYLWIDDLQYARQFQQFGDSRNLAEEVIHWMIQNLPASCQILLTSRQIPVWWPHDSRFKRLAGLQFSEVCTWFDKNGIELEDNKIHWVKAKTEGYPLLLNFFFWRVDVEGIDSAIGLLEKAGPVNDMSDFFSKRIFDSLQFAERHLVSVMALLTHSETWHFVNTIASNIGLPNPNETLSQLKYLLIFIDSTSEIELFHSRLKEYVYEALSQEKGFYHRQIATAYAERAISENTSVDWLEAAEHYCKGKNFVETADILTRYADELLNSIYRSDTFTILSNLTINQFEDEKNLWQKVLRVRSKFAFQLGDNGLAIESYRQLYQLTNNPKWQLKEARVYNRRVHEGDQDLAIDLLEDVINKADIIQDITLQTQVASEMGRAYYNLDKLEVAREHLTKSLCVFEPDIDIALAKVSYRTAKRQLRLFKVLEQFRDGAAWTFRYLGLTYIRQGQAPQAMACWFTAIRLWKLLKDPINQAAMLANLGAVYLDFSISLHEAQNYLEEARSILDEQEAFYDSLRVYLNLTHLYARQGDFAKSIENWEYVYARAKDGFPIQVYEALDIRGGIIYTSVGKWEAGEDDLKQAVSLCQIAEQPVDERLSSSNLGFLYLSWGRTLLSMGNTEQATEKYEKAKKQFEKTVQLEKEFSLGNQVHPAQLSQTKAGIVEILIHKGHVDLARQEFNTIQKFASPQELPFDVPFFVQTRVLRVWGELLWQEARPVEAESKFLKAWQVLSEEPDKTGVDKQEVWVLEDLVNLYEELEQVESANRYQALLQQRAQIYQLNENT